MPEIHVAPLRRKQIGSYTPEIDEAEGGKEVWADSAYRSDEQEQSLKDSQHSSQDRRAHV